MIDVRTMISSLSDSRTTFRLEESEAEAVVKIVAAEADTTTVWSYSRDTKTWAISVDGYTEIGRVVKAETAEAFVLNFIRANLLYEHMMSTMTAAVP